MRPMRVLVLMHEDLVPPESLNGSDPSQAEWKTEYDVVTTLRKLGHEVKPLGVKNDLGVIRTAVEEWKPHIAFNLLEEFPDRPGLWFVPLPVPDARFGSGFCHLLEAEPQFGSGGGQIGIVRPHPDQQTVASGLGHFGQFERQRTLGAWSLHER